MLEPSPLFEKYKEKATYRLYAHTGLPKKGETKDDCKLLKCDDPNVILCNLS